MYLDLLVAGAGGEEFVIRREGTAENVIIMSLDLQNLLT